MFALRGIRDLPDRATMIPTDSSCLQTRGDLALSQDELLAIYKVKYFRVGEPGWGPRMRLSFNYFLPDDYYEALVAKIVRAGCTWADVGCGRDIFPSNPDLARELCGKAEYVLGVDPDENIKQNRYIHESFLGAIEDCATDRQFDVITLRMVAEHIARPERAIGRISEMLKPGGRLVIYTPHKWTPMAMAASVVPFRFHNALKRILWQTEARDTFPTTYKLNTRRDLALHTAACGLTEMQFLLLDDCSVTNRFRVLNWLELGMRSVLRSQGVGHPERCILAVYEKRAA